MILIVDGYDPDDDNLLCYPEGEATRCFVDIWILIGANKEFRHELREKLENFDFNLNSIRIEIADDTQIYKPTYLPDIDQFKIIDEFDKEAGPAPFVHYHDQANHTWAVCGELQKFPDGERLFTLNGILEELIRELGSPNE